MNFAARPEGVLLSAIIVNRGTGKPAAGFAAFARDRGFDAPVSSLQHEVFEHFGR